MEDNLTRNINTVKENNNNNKQITELILNNRES